MLTTDCHECLHRDRSTPAGDRGRGRVPSSYRETCMSTGRHDPLFVILIAPNVSEQMGGEAIKALQIYRSLVGRGVQVHQITHSRVRDELARVYPKMQVSFVEEGPIDAALWRSKILRGLITPYFMKRAARVAQRLVDANPGAVVHYTSPVSPVLPLFPIRGARVVVGPLNGNIHHPPAFRGRECLSDRLRRRLLRPSQLIHRSIFSGKQAADVLLVAGGERTAGSLRIAGCRPERMLGSLDSGILDVLRERSLVEHRGANYRFVHNGRLVPHKGTDLAIRAVARTRHPVELDIIGRGPSLDDLQRLVAELHLEARVHFIDWFKDHEEMHRALRQYRAFVFPSLAEANGIVVQEAMMIGLPVICADWGGPSLLVTPETGVAIPPTSEDALIVGLAEAMDRLGADGELGDRMARAGRREALDRGFSWSDLIERWISIYRGSASASTPLPSPRSVPRGVSELIGG